MVVDFSATWCGPCRFITPAYEALSEKYATADFVKVDVDECKSIAQRCGVTAMPTFQFLRGGRKVGEVKGANAAALELALTQHLKG